MGDKGKPKEIRVGTDNLDILDEIEYEVFKDYADKFLGQNGLERIGTIQKELLKTLIYIDKQLREIDEMTQGKGFVRSVYEQKNNLIAQRTAILKQLAELQLKLEEQVSEEPDSIKDVLFSND